MIKKVISMTTVFLMLLTLTSCSNNTAVPDNSTNSSDETSITTQDNEAPSEDTTSTAPDNETPSENTIPTAKEVAKKMGVGLNLGNTMESFSADGGGEISYEWMPTVGNNTPKEYETFWGAVETTQEIIDGIKAEGFDTVRIPVFWGDMMENDGTYTINADFIGRVKEIVDYCQNAGLYAVINIHHFDEFLIRRHTVEECKEIFSAIWTQIADYFKDYPYTLLFEGFNEALGGKQFNEKGKLVEPSKAEAYRMTNTLNQAFVDAVRSTGGNNAERVLIISGYCTNIDNTTSSEFVVPTDSAKDKLMVSVHYVDNLMYWINQIGGQSWLDYTDSQIELLNKAFTDKNIPVFMGETSAGYPSDRFDKDAIHKDSSECVKIVLEKLIDNGFVPVIWDINDGFYSRTDHRVKSDSDRAVIKEITDKLHKE